MNNFKIGLIYCCYGNPEYINNCIKPWINLKENLYDIKIAAVNGQFKEYHDMGLEDNNFDTELKLNKLKESGAIDYLYIQNPTNYFDEFKIYETEGQIRDKALQYLLKEECDIIWLLDNDEFYTEEQIEQIIDVINLVWNKDITWFSILMKNYIFSGKKYIAGFAPPRIFRVNANPWTRLYNFYYDNDVMYEDKEKGQLNNYKLYESKKIPVGIKHLTWLHSNGKEKVNYQLKHFGHCSYKWNEQEQKIEIDYDFYIRNGLNFPIIYQDE